MCVCTRVHACVCTYTFTLELNVLFLTNNGDHGSERGEPLHDSSSCIVLSLNTSYTNQPILNNAKK